jgi:hypothetical protein
MGDGNPFQITKPVDPPEVIGRDEETHQLVHLAIEGNNARLVAPRRFGKTSLLRRVQAELKAQGWVTVYVDLLGIVTRDDFAARIERAYLESLRGGVARWFMGLRRSLKPAGTVGGGPVPAALTVDLSGRGTEALVTRLGLPEKVYEKTGKRVHVVFDEFQELDAAGEELDGVVRSVIQHHGNAASYVFSGSRLHMMEMLFGDPRRAFYAQTQRVALGRLGPQALAEYVDTRFESTNKRLEAGVLDALLGLVDGHPQRAMAAAHALWDATQTTADLGEWETAYESLMDAVDDELKATWSVLDPAERRTLAVLVAGDPPYRREDGKPQGSTVTRALRAMEGVGTIEKAPDGRWRVVDPLLAEWVKVNRRGVR